MRWEGLRLLRQAGEETTVAPEVAPEAQQIHIDRGWLLHRSKPSIDFLQASEVKRNSRNARASPF